MDSGDLEKLWSQIHYEPPSQYIYKRIDTICLPELNVGINANLNRCLILELPKAHSVDFQAIVRENLALYYFHDTNCVVLELLDKSFNDLFGDLVLSLYHSIMNLNEVSGYSTILIQTFHKWSEFFLAKSFDRLSDEIVKGLFGELYILRSFILNSKTSEVNDILRSWQGPYDRGHDFVFDDKNIEVKTKKAAKLTIKISSEYQLEQELGKKLELVVISLENDSDLGLSIGGLIDSIRLSVVKCLGDTSILLDALRQKSLTFKNMHEYDNCRYVYVADHTYDPTMKEFPRVIKSELPSSITEVKYSLNLSLLESFLIKSGSFKWI